MLINITARHFKAPEKLKRFADNELHRLERFYDGIIDCNMVMDYIQANRSKHQVEIHLNVYGKVLKVSDLSDDMYKSIDRAIIKLERKLQKYKARIRGFSHKKVVSYVEENSSLYEEE